MGEPLDLRLVPAGAVAWAAAVVGVGLGVREALAAAGLLAAGALTGVALAGRRGTWGPVVVALCAGSAVLASCAGHLAAREAGPLRAAAADRAVVVATGRVQGEVVPETAPWRSGQVHVVVGLDTLAVHGRVARASGEVLVVGDPAVLDLPSGAQVRVTGRLASLAGRLEAVLTAVDAVLLDRGSVPDRVVAALHAGLHAAVAPLGSDARGLVPGAAVGDTAGLAPELETAMRTSGLSHLVAVSGQHVAIVLLTALSLAGLTRAPPLLRAGMAGLAVLGFTVLVGGGASVLRSAVMGGVGVLGLAVGRPSRPVPALAIAVVALLVHDPWAAGALGFQLSVVATAAIVLLAGPAARAVGDRWPRWSRGVRGRLVAAAMVPLAAQSAVSPVLVLVDPVVSPWAVPANLLAAPAVVPVTLLGLGATLTGWWPVVAAALARAAAVPAAWIAGVARACAALPGAATDWRPGPAGAVGLTALLAAGWLAAHLLGRRDA